MCLDGFCSDFLVSQHAEEGHGTCTGVVLGSQLSWTNVCDVQEGAVYWQTARMFFNYSDPLSIIQLVWSIEGEHKGTYRWVVLNWTKDQTIWPQHPRALSAVPRGKGMNWQIDGEHFNLLAWLACCSTVTKLYRIYRLDFRLYLHNYIIHRRLYYNSRI